MSFEYVSKRGRSKLVEEVMAEVQRHIRLGNFRQINRLLRSVPRHILIDFLPENIREKYEVKY